MPRRDTAGAHTRAAIYARVSTADQNCENQVHELRRYCEARGWTATDYVDAGVSGSKDRRPALDRLITDAAARRLDVVVCWRLDRFGRNLRHLINTIEELAAVGVAFVSIGESIDTGTPTGRLLLGVLGSFAQFERERIRERIHAGLARARRQGTKLGRRHERIPVHDLERVDGLSLRAAAQVLHVPATRIRRERERLRQKPLRPSVSITEKTTPDAPSI